LFGTGFALFLILRSTLIPADFGVLGFYRAGALDENQQRPMGFAGEAVCADCHVEVVDLRRGSRHEPVKCEACHGPAARHAADFGVSTPTLDPVKLCLGCHTRLAGKPKDFPQIVIADHFEGSPCIECHQPHRPGDPPKEP
jgi:hypothetical protein